MQKEYDLETLKRLQRAELNILMDFDRVCEKHGIYYFLYGGSLLGAIRHEGFIPWDDDIDIGMTRENYNKFVKVMSKELGNDYILATPLSHEGYCSAIIKLMRKGTKFVPGFSTEMKCDLGIHIDIFVWDNLCGRKLGAWIQIKTARILSQMLFLCGSSKPIIPYKGIWKTTLKYICNIAHRILALIPNIEKGLYKFFMWLSMKENGRNTSYIVSFQSQNPHKCIYTKKDLSPYIRKNFDGCRVYVPNNYKANLRVCFGNDYMSLPPKEKRINHCAETIDFGDIY